MLPRGHDQRTREETRADIDSLIVELSKLLRGGSGKILIPPIVDMADGVFVEVMVANLKAGNDPRIKQFLTDVIATNVNTDAFYQAPGKLTIIVVQTPMLGLSNVAK